MKLHLYIFPAEGLGSRSGFQKAAESFVNKSIELQVTSITASRLYLVNAHYATWYGYIYDNEYLSKGLNMALPTLLNHEENNFYVFFKRVRKLILRLDGQKWDFFMSPRIFRSHVELQKELLIPKNPKLKNEYILDGWVEQRWPTT